ncbi:MAG: hypothetical protein ACTHN0_00550 [Aquihabitans sp.]
MSQAIDAQFTLGETSASSAEDLLKVRYARHAITPIPWMVASLVALLAAFWAIDWSEVGRGATDIVETSEWWANVYRVLQPAGDPRLASYSEFRMWTAMAIMVIAAISIAVWIGRLGRNLRPAHSPFGAILPLVALPAWWVLPLTLGATDTSARSRGDALLRYLIAFGILFAQYLLLRWPLLNRVWRAGRLPYDMASILLWLPMLIPWSMLLLSSAFTLLVTGDGENPADSAWRPTLSMADWANNLTKVTEVGILVLLVAVTVSQHIGIQKDRAEERERRAANADPMGLTRLPAPEAP